MDWEDAKLYVLYIMFLKINGPKESVEEDFFKVVDLSDQISNYVSLYYHNFFYTLFLSSSSNSGCFHFQHYIFYTSVGVLLGILTFMEKYYLNLRGRH